MKADLRDRVGSRVIGVFIDACSWALAIHRVVDWGAKRESKYVCVCNVHSVVTASENSDFFQVLEKSDMSIPDGAPIAWMLRRFGYITQQRINGPDLMWHCCERASELNLAVFLYGGEASSLQNLQSRLAATFPTLRIAGAISPPYRELTEDEDAEIVTTINNSGAAIVWVGLGCPKQEIWMAAHRGKIRAVMVGVGAAFDYHSMATARAPVWMQKTGLEWLHRLACEPRRLWRRYLFTNSAFLLAAGRQLLDRKRFF